jgi:muconolactone D-isomerase
MQKKRGTCPGCVQLYNAVADCFYLNGAIQPVRFDVGGELSRRRSTGRWLVDGIHMGDETMLYLVHMVVNIPSTLAAEQAQKLKDEEKAMSQKLQQAGTWRHLWRVAGEYANYSVIDVESHDALHQLLTALPLFPFMSVKVTPLAQHPSAIAPN